jgi:hypothetical protein
MSGAQEALTRDERIRAATEGLRAWIDEQDDRGWDPHDALMSPLLRPIARVNRWVGVALLQTVKRSPVNLRPLLGVRRGINPKGMGLLLIAATERWLRTGSADAAEEAARLAVWLRENATPGYAGPAWGYNFDWPNRNFLAPAGTPTVVNTSVIALALRDAAASGVLRVTGCDVDGRAMARASCDFLLRDLQTEGGPDELIFSYTPLDRSAVHNASTWAAWLLAACASDTGERALRDSALAAARYTARRQRDDGSWPYGVGRRISWVDNFHTGFVLDALNAVGGLLRVAEFEDAIARGYVYWRERMFDPDGAPRYYDTTRWPVDSHAVAQAALTHLRIAPEREAGLERAAAVLEWGIDHMLDPGGWFHYQLRRTGPVRTPFLRWSQAWMLHALEAYLLRKEGSGVPPVGTIL